VHAFESLSVSPTPLPEGPAPLNAPPCLPANFLSLVDPGVHVFRGCGVTGAQRVAVVSPYFPFPLSHGGAIRIFNLTRAAAKNADISLFAFAEKESGREMEPLLDFCRRIVLVETPRWEPPRVLRLWPSGVSKFRSAAMNAAIRQVVEDEQISVVQVEYTQLAHLRTAVQKRNASTILVEHDVTFDLYRQLRLRAKGRQRLRAWLEEVRWRRFEIAGACGFDRVIAMSGPERERLIEAGVPAEKLSVVENGVDLDRFRAVPEDGGDPEVLFIGSFRHFPNMLGFRSLLEEVWPVLSNMNPRLKLTVVAGAEHRYYWSRYMKSELGDLPPEIELLDFVADVRPLYERAAVVLVPLVVSAGTNIKVLEALAMGRAVVSTSVGVAGLGLSHKENVLIADTARDFAEAVDWLLRNTEERHALAERGRTFVAQHYGWDALGVKLQAAWGGCTTTFAAESATSSKSYRPVRAS
jgi:glycosyltransferase involved in cell wall biosynthesis